MTRPLSQRDTARMTALYIARSGTPISVRQRDELAAACELDDDFRAELADAVELRALDEERTIEARAELAALGDRVRELLLGGDYRPDPATPGPAILRNPAAPR